MSSIDQYLALYREHNALLEAHSHPVLNAHRAQALAQLEATGLPSSRAERYRYCNVEGDLAPDFGLNLRRSLPVGDPYKGYRCGVPEMKTALFYVVNDVVCSADGKAVLPEGVHVLPLCEAATRFPEVVQRHYNTAATRKADALSALNTLLVQDGLFVYVERGVTIEQTLQIVYVSAAAADMMSNRRVLVVVEEDATANLLMCDHSMDATHQYLSTQVVEAFVGERAQLHIYTMEETQEANARYANLYVEQQAQSQTSLCDLTLHNGHTRNQTEVRLLGEGADVALNGAYIAAKEETLSSDIVVEHAVPNCHSSMLHKYVVGDKGVSAFAGRVVVAEGAQQTLAEQTNANLLASSTARAFSQPMLEIYADDVKCNHGSTIGKLDETALFYMRQRGVPEQEARLLLQHAFINEVVETVHIDPLRQRVSALVEARFRGEDAGCHDGCANCGGHCI